MTNSATIPPAGTATSPAARATPGQGANTLDLTQSRGFDLRQPGGPENLSAQRLEELLKAEEKIDAAARQKIENQRRTIVEGTQEWDILYRKYYNEEVKKLGISGQRY